MFSAAINDPGEEEGYSGPRPLPPSGPQHIVLFFFEVPNHDKLTSLNYSLVFFLFNIYHLKMN